MPVGKGRKQKNEHSQFGRKHNANAQAELIRLTSNDRFAKRTDATGKKKECECPKHEHRPDGRHTASPFIFT